MEQTTVKNVSLSDVQTNMKNYFATHDLKYLAEDAEFIDMSSGEKYTGKEEIGGMLHYVYHVAFEAEAVIKNTIVTEDKALLEADLKGRHIGEIAGLKPTNKEVNIPFCVSYDLENGLVKKARIYMLGEVMMKQLAG